MKDVPYTAYVHRWFIQNDRLVSDATIWFEATYTAERGTNGHVTLATWKVSKCVQRMAGDGNKEKQLVAPGVVIVRREEDPVRKSEDYLVDGKPPDNALAGDLHHIVGLGEVGSYAEAGAGGSRAVGDEWRLDSAIVGTEFSRDPKSPLTALPQDIKATAKLLAVFPVDGVPSLAVLTDSHIAKLHGRPGVLPRGLQITDGTAWQKNLFVVPAADGKSAGVCAEVTDGSVAFASSDNVTRRLRVHLARTTHAAAGDHSDSVIKAIESLGQSFEGKSTTTLLPGTFVRKTENGTTTTTLTFDKDGGYQRDAGDASIKKIAGRWTFEAGVLTLEEGQTTAKLPLLFCDKDGLLLGKAEGGKDAVSLPAECFYHRAEEKK
jgi:hypothetical protein